MSWLLTHPLTSVVAVIVPKLRENDPLISTFAGRSQLIKDLRDVARIFLVFNDVNPYFSHCSFQKFDVGPDYE